MVHPARDEISVTMDEQTKQTLLAKREEGTSKLKQAEADVYFFQGYLQAINELLNQPAEPEKEVPSNESQISG